MTVVGVMAPRNISREVREELANLGIRNYDFDIYTPIKTILLRYENRALVTAKDVTAGQSKRETQKSGNSKLSPAGQSGAACGRCALQSKIG